ncbi:hypothetical protein B4113_1531 [Geobacillus sp. B4113_201601]|nr:hypothetical protein B4113_1531 [Geobacillus sp. B4113_201601]
MHATDRNNEQCGGMAVWDVMMVALLVVSFLLFYEFSSWCDSVVSGGEEQ